MAEVDLRYFGRVREAMGRDTERVDPPSHVLTIDDLVKWLSNRGAPYFEAMAPPLRAAVDHEWANGGDSFFGAREVALFPPVGAL
jgi:sulfur-carrier protein